MRRARRAHQVAGERRPRSAVDVLAVVPAFAGCDPTTLQRVAELGTELRRGPGTVLEREGRLLRQATVVLEGEAVERPGGGRPRAVSAGHVVGEAALRRRDAVSTSSVVAETAVSLLVFGPTDLAEVAQLVAGAQHAAAQAAQRTARRVPAPAPTWGIAGGAPSLP